jgi:hypothetical protein
MTTPAPFVCPPKRKLSDEIDRLNHILDGLGDALLAAVTDAAREGGRVAVKEALGRALARPATPPAGPVPAQKTDRPSAWVRIRALFRNG